MAHSTDIEAHLEKASMFEFEDKTQMRHRLIALYEKCKPYPLFESCLLRLIVQYIPKPETPFIHLIGRRCSGKTERALEFISKNRMRCLEWWYLTAWWTVGSELVSKCIPAERIITNATIETYEMLSRRQNIGIIMDETDSFMMRRLVLECKLKPCHMVHVVISQYEKTFGHRFNYYNPKCRDCIPKKQSLNFKPIIINSRRSFVHSKYVKPESFIPEAQFE